MIGDWRSLGPTLIDAGLGATGRITSIVIDETDPSTMYVAASSGNPAQVGGCGIWVSTNSGATWRPIGDSLPNLRIAALALAPGAGSPLYAAVMGQGRAGGGLYRSDDRGAAWERLSDETALTGRLLLIDPQRPSRMFMANSRAVLRSLDGGASWSAILSPEGNVSDLAMHPLSPTRLYAGVSHDVNDAITGVYESRDSGETWVKLLGCPGAGLPTAVAGHSIRLAVAPNRTYASFKSRQEFLLYSTTGIGCSVGGRLESEWERVWSVGSDVAPSIWSYIYAHPTDPDVVYVTGTNFRRSTNGGRDFSLVTGPHVDHHALVVHPTDRDVIHVGTDGGLYHSSDRGAGGSWSFAGKGISNTEFYDLAHAPTDPAVVIGGTQDNGTLRIPASGSVWDEIRGGDGGTVAIDPTDAEILYSMGQYATQIARQSHGGSWQNISAGLPEGSVCFNLHYQVHPTTPTTLLASCRSLWRTTTVEPPGDWKPLFPPAGFPSIQGNVVRSAVGARTDTYYAATSAGSLYAGVGGENWERVFDLADDCGVARTAITAVEADPEDSSVVFVATAGSGACRVVRLRRVRPDALPMTARDITSDLPDDVAVATLAVDRMHPGTIYVGTTDRAVFRGRAGAADTWRWDRYSSGLPFATCVTHLLSHPVTGVLRAGTCGRGAFEVDTDHSLGSVLAIEGRVTFLRVHDAGGYGPPTDRIEGEVVVRIDTDPRKAFGFALRADADGPAHAGMLGLLRQAMGKRSRVRLEYLRTGLRNNRLIRAEIVG
ncbi:MAG: WD40/YVTN/BNR-like repeat-containing protein [Streptosporangiales bacterium]